MVVIRSGEKFGFISPFIPKKLLRNQIVRPKYRSGGATTLERTGPQEANY
jgi:hypothetical protein